MDLTETHQPFSFPLLKGQEILLCLSEAGIPVTLEILKDPNRHKETVKSIFASLLQITLGLDKNSFSTHSQSTEDIRSTLPYPELHAESFANLKFLKSCMKLMKICGIYNDFGFQDLIAPTPQRLRRQLSAAINFIKFREDKLQFYAELHEGRNELFAGLNEVKEEKAMLQEQLQKAQEAADGRWNEANEVDNDCSALEAEITQQNKLQAAIRDESTKLKKESNELKNKLAAMELSLKEVETEEKKLQEKIVPSPEKIKNRSTELMKELESKQAECEVSKKEGEMNKLRLSNVTRALADVKVATKLGTDLIEEEKKLKSIIEELNNIKKKYAESDKENRAVSAIFEEKEQVLRLADDRKENNKKQFKVKMEASQKSWNKTNAMLLNLEKDRRDGKTRLETGEEEVRILKQIIEEENQRTQNEINEMITKYKKMEQCIMEQNEEFLNALGA